MLTNSPHLYKNSISIKLSRIIINRSKDIYVFTTRLNWYLWNLVAQSGETCL